MNSLKKVFDFYIFSNIHVGIAGFCLAKISLFKFGIHSNLAPLLIGFSIIISYNFIRYFEINSKRLGWFKSWFFQNEIRLVWVSILAFLCSIYIVFFTKFNFESLFIIFPFGFITVFYAIPLFKIGKLQVSFRNFPAIKIFSIAIAWAGVTVLFPLLEQGYHFNYDVYLEFLQRILILIAYTIPFDIRDVNLDDKQLKTIPLLVGVRNSKIVGTILLFLFVLLDLVKHNYFEKENFSQIIIAVIVLLFLWNATTKQSRYYTSFFVESIPILWFLSILLF
ncbi:MAG: hypothetical protein QM495_03175 [Lutibacter sp.]|uniref:hypothetical protein n=1 Tax=Lutibacter sp. TaxID=1925666 RepID=UPI00385AF691